MNGSDNILTIIFLALAIVIFIRLRSVLGRRTGNERGPFDPYARSDRGGEQDDKVIALPPRQGGETEPPATSQESAVDIETRVKAVAAPGSAVGKGLKELIIADPSFDPTAFVDGAKMAYEMVVTAFAEGDRRTLRQLLSSDVNDGFVAAISERENREETIEFKFVGVNKVEVTDVSIRAGNAQVTVRFVSELISTTRDKDGKIVDGDANKLSEVTDRWTFSRAVAAGDPNWKLAATESVE